MLYTCTYVRTLPWYHGTHVPYQWYGTTLSQKRLEILKYNTQVQGRNYGHSGRCQHVRIAIRTCTYVPVVRTTIWYVRTNMTLSQKRLEIQALRCNGETSGRCQHRRHHGILRFQLDSDVCSADLHHNPRKHLGLHAHQRLHRLPDNGLSGRPRLRVPRVVVLAGHLLAWIGTNGTMVSLSSWN
jgi:hypothetical protein